MRGKLVCVGIVLYFLVAGFVEAQKTDVIYGTIGITTSTTESETQCQGDDGPYSQSEVRFSGSLTSTDSRVTGTLSVHGFFLVNTLLQKGTGGGTFSIKDSNGDVRMQGRFEGVITTLGRFKGLARARLPNGARMTTNFSVIVSPQLNTAAGNFGSPLTGVESDPAVIQSGSCSGNDFESQILVV